MSPSPRNLDDWLAHIQRQHWRSVDLQLDRIARVWARLGGQTSGLVLTVAGTNGKGSCAAMLAAVLRAAGLSAGVYTSPHLVRYNERVTVDRRPATDAELCAAFTAIERARGDIPLTYFEFGTLCALLIFQRHGVDATVLEVGMGGRLDAVNLVANDLALITAIGIDHAQWLGDTRDAIGAEKAGVFKPGAWAVCAEPRPPKCIAQIAAARGCRLVQAGVDYEVARAGDGVIEWRSEHPAVPVAWRNLRLKTPLPGAWQARNLGGVVAATALTAARTGVTVAQLKSGLAAVALCARCQVIPATGTAPETVLDVAHNPDAAAVLAEFLAARPPAKTHAVFTALADKPVADIVAPLAGAVDHWHITGLDGERGRPAAAVAAEVTVALAAGDSTATVAAGDGDINPRHPRSLLSGGGAGEAATVATHASPLDAYRAAVAAAPGRIVAFGSFQLVGVIMAHLDSGSAP